MHGLSIGGIPACHLASKRNINLIIADRTFGSTKDIIDSFSFGNIFYIVLQKLFFSHLLIIRQIS